MPYPILSLFVLDEIPVAVLRGSGAAGALADVYFVYPDHLNTARVIARASDNAIVWRWDMSDPFGVAQPAENPSGLGVFNYNPRFPEQVFDRETNRHYNYFRDYDPQTGRYVQSDPIGLGGGINTYGYSYGNPVSNVDPTGLLVAPGLPPAIATLVPAGGVSVASTGAVGGAFAGGVIVGLSFNFAYEKLMGEPLGLTIYDAVDKVCKSDHQKKCEALLNKINGSNPGKDGTFEGHVDQIVGLEIGLQRLIQEAKDSGCL